MTVVHTHAIILGVILLDSIQLFITPHYKISNEGIYL